MHRNDHRTDVHRPHRRWRLFCLGVRAQFVPGLRRGQGSVCRSGERTARARGGIPIMVGKCFTGVGVPAVTEQICSAAHICSYVEFRNMWRLWPGRPVTLYNRANLPRIFLAAFSIGKRMQSINLSSNLSPKIPFLREFTQFYSR